MRTDELERLLWLDAEGELAAEERARLAALLAAHPAGERRRRDVAAFAELLAGVEDVPPPSGLAARIERAIAARPRPRPRAPWRGSLVRLLVRPHRAPLAWAAAGVLVAAAAVLLLATDPRRSPHGDGRFVGALGAAPGEPAAGAEEALPDGLGSIALTGGQGALVCRLRVDRAIPGGLTVVASGAGVTMRALGGEGAATRVLPAAPDRAGCAVEGPGLVELEVRAPAGADAVVVRVAAAGATVFVRRVDLGGAAPR